MIRTWVKLQEPRMMQVDGAGFTVDSGDGDKTWNFEATGDNWGSSENINLASGKVLKVNNTF